MFCHNSLFPIKNRGGPWFIPFRDRSAFCASTRSAQRERASIHALVAWTGAHTRRRQI